MYDFQVLFKREKFSKIIFWETLIICVLFIMFYCGKHPEYLGSKYDISFLYNDKFNVFSLMIMMITPIIGSLPYSDNYYIEDNLRHLIICKKGKKKYYLEKYTIVFISGMINCLFVLELIFFLQLVSINVSGSVYCSDGSLTYNFLFPEESILYLPDILIERPYLLNQLVYLLISLFSGCCGCLSYALSQKIPIKGLAYVYSFLVLFTISFLLQYFPKIGYLLVYYNIFRLSSHPLDFNADISILTLICLIWIILVIALTTIIQLVVEFRNE